MRALLTVVVLVLCAACGTDQPGPEPRDPGRIRIASFDFPESRLVAELYARALRRAGLPVDVLSGLGTRELVAPALQQGQVDVVVDYTGSLLDHLGGDGTETHGTPEQVHAALQRRLAGRGLTALAYAPAEDANAFAVPTAYARAHRISRLSDLRRLAGGLTFGGPPECPTRRYCLQGLRDTYGLRFAGFRAQPSRAATATALESGDIGVGVLESTSGLLGTGQLTLLVDDLNLQPRENLVPVVRTDVVARYGPPFTSTLDAVSARLSSADLVRLNHIAAVNPVGPAEAVDAY
ncbi:MAG TPA: ABC transporter substrate-binding protein, partial [Mycobacteriales bacterium]|nr:ABC transporter substrate-binding protein [Mycobacteriales bacterium]